MKTSNFFTYPHNLEVPCIGKSDFKCFKFICLDDLYTNHPELDEVALSEKVRGKNLTIPYVIKLRGIMILIDGHHTIAAKIINGQKKAKVMFIDFD